MAGASNFKFGQKVEAVIVKRTPEEALKAQEAQAAKAKEAKNESV